MASHSLRNIFRWKVFQALAAIWSDDDPVGTPLLGGADDLHSDIVLGDDRIFLESSVSECLRDSIHQLSCLPDMFILLTHICSQGPRRSGAPAHAIASTTSNILTSPCCGRWREIRACVTASENLELSIASGIRMAPSRLVLNNESRNGLPGAVVYRDLMR